MAFTETELDDRISQLQEGIDSVSEVQFEGEATKYRTIKEIKEGIKYFGGLKKLLLEPKKKRNRFRPVVMSIDRGL